MPKPIPHSKLTKLLIDFENTTPKNLSAYIGKVIRDTSGGVTEEAGELLHESLPGSAADSEVRTDDVDMPNETGFGFSKASLNELKGVNDDLVKCVSLALKRYTAIDFRVFDGIRTVEEQRKYVAAGTSKTMRSKHLDGLAVDLVPIIGGVLKWDWVGCYEIAKAMDMAATKLGIADRITWGGAWDKTLADYGGAAGEYAKAVEEYRRRHPGPDFIDGPHFEIRG